MYDWIEIKFFAYVFHCCSGSFLKIYFFYILDSFIITFWDGKGLLTFIIVSVTLTDSLSSSLMFLLHAAMPLFLSSSRDIPGLINCHTLLLSAIRKAGKWLLFPPVSHLILPRLLQLVKFTFYALSRRVYPESLTIREDSKISQHLWIAVILH